jgi:hypothetical protein
MSDTATAMFVSMQERLLVRIAMHCVQHRRARSDVVSDVCEAVTSLHCLCVSEPPAPKPDLLLQYSCSRHHWAAMQYAHDGDHDSNNHQPHKARHARSGCVHSRGVGCVCGQKHQGSSCAGSFKVESCVWAPLHKPTLGTKRVPGSGAASRLHDATGCPVNDNHTMTDSDRWHCSPLTSAAPSRTSFRTTTCSQGTRMPCFASGGTATTESARSSLGHGSALCL